MKTILRWCISNGYLPRRRWFFRLVKDHLMQRLGRDGMWVFDLGYMGPDQVAQFRAWYDTMAPDG